MLKQLAPWFLVAFLLGVLAGGAVVTSRAVQLLAYHLVVVADAVDRLQLRVEGIEEDHGVEVYYQENGIR